MECSRKGQLQTLEPIVIVIVLVLIAGIGLLFWVNLADSQSRQSVQAYDGRESLALLQRITTLPELACSLSETSGTYCIDEKKAWAFSRFMQDPRLQIRYQPILGFSNITLEWYDLDDRSTSRITLYDTLEGDEVRVSSTYFTVHDPISDTRKFAVLTVAREIQ